MTAAFTSGLAVVVATAEDGVNPGLLGFFVVAALAVATWLLIRSMNKQIRKIDIPADPATDRSDPAAEPPGGVPDQQTGETSGPDR